MKKLLLLFGLYLLILPSNAQDSEPITIVKRNHYYQQDVRLRTKTIKEIVKPNLIAFQEVKSGRSMIGWSYGIAFFSGAMIGSGIAQPVESPGAMIGVGAAGVVGAIILDLAGLRRIERGVNTYNSSLSSSSSRNPASLKFGIADHGVGLTVTF